MRSRSSSRAEPRPSPQHSPYPSPRPSPTHPPSSASASPSPSPHSSPQSLSASCRLAHPAALSSLPPLCSADMPPAASVAPASSHYHYASPPSRRVKAVFKATSIAAPPTPSHAVHPVAHTVSVSPLAQPPHPHPHPAQQRPAKPKPSPPSTPREAPLPASSPHYRATSSSSPGTTPTAAPRFHALDVDNSPSASPKQPSPSAAAAQLSPKPPSPPLNHTNTFYRIPAPLLASPPCPPPLLSSGAAPLVSRRSLNQSMAVMTAETGSESKSTATPRASRLMVAAGPPSPSPPPPSPSSSSSSTRTSSHLVPSLHKITSLPSFSFNPPTLPSPSHAGRTVSSPVVIHSVVQSTGAPVLPGAPGMSASASALSLLHASHVFVKTSSTLLSRWQKRWLMLTQHRAPACYRLTLYAQPGQSDPLDTLAITIATTVTASTDKRKQCRLCIKSDNKELIIDCLDVAEKTAWNLSLQQSILLTQHSASALSPSAPRPLSFPPSSTASALTSWQQYFFHLYYSLPEVGYVHAHYDAAMAKFAVRFADEEAIVRYLLDSVKEEVRRDKPASAGTDQRTTLTVNEMEDSSSPVYVNESAMTAYLSAKFSASSIPNQLLNHAISTNTPHTPTLQLHPVPFSHASNPVPPPVMIDPINQAQLLTTPNMPSSPLHGPSRQRFEQRLHSPGTLYHLSPLLFSSSPALSALAFRLLWLIVGNVYPPALTSSIVQLHLALLAPKVRGSSEMIASMRCLLFAPSVAQDTVALRSSFLRPSVLPCLLSSLAFSSFSLRESTLKDLSACLLQQSNNIMAFASLPQWQVLLLSLLTDVHYDVVKDIGGLDKREMFDCEEIASISVGGESLGRIVWHEDITMRADYQQQRNVYSYVHNMFAVIHYRAFLTVPSAQPPAASSPLSFASLLCASMDSLFTFAGPRITTQRTALLMLSTLLNLIDANIGKHSVLHSTDTRSADWRNLSALLAIVRAYTFHCHHWIATDSDTHTYLTAQSNIRLVLYQCKFRHPAFTPFHSLLDTKPASSDTVGVHFDEEGAAADLPLVKRVLGILEAVRLDCPPDASANYRASGEEDDRAYLLSLHHYYLFYESSYDFLSGLQERLQSDDTINIRLLREAVVAFMDAEDVKVKREGGKKPSKPWKIDGGGRGSVSDGTSRTKAELSRTVLARDSQTVHVTPPTKRASQTRRSEQEASFRTPPVRRQLHSELAKEKSTTLASHISLPHHTPPSPTSVTHSNGGSITDAIPAIQHATHQRVSSDSLLAPELYSKLSQRIDEQQLARESSEETRAEQRHNEGGSYVSTEKLDRDSDGEDRSRNEREQSGSRTNKDSWCASSLDGANGGDVDGLQVVAPATP